MTDDDKQSHRYSDEDVITAVREQDNATTRDVSEQLGCTKNGARFRLKRLEEKGRVTSQTVGNVAVWSVVENDESA